MRALERGVWLSLSLALSSKEQGSSSVPLRLTSGGERRMQGGEELGMLEQVLQDVHVLLQRGERMLLGQA